LSAEFGSPGEGMRMSCWWDLQGTPEIVNNR
jgi:hypothetical protein